MYRKQIFRVCLMIVALSISAFGVTISETLDTTVPAANPSYRANTGTQTGRLTRNGIASVCGSLKANPGTNPTTGLRQYDEYRFVALSSGCLTVTLSNAGDNTLFGTAYNQSGIVPANPSSNYIADMGLSPTTTTTTRSFSFIVTAGQIFNIVIHEVDPAGAVGQTYTLDVGGVKLVPDFSVTETLDTSLAQLNPAYTGGTGTLTGRLNRSSPASDCTSLKPNPGLFTTTGARRGDLYSFTPATSGCARVTLTHTGADSAQIVVYDHHGFVSSNPSANYLADSGASSTNGTVTFSFMITRGVPFYVVVSEVNPDAGLGDSYTLNISNVKLTPEVKVTSTLDGVTPSTNPDFARGTGTQTGRLNRFPPASGCNNPPKSNPGLNTATGIRQYDRYTFTPTRSGCVEVTLAAYQASDLYAVAYDNGGFNPSDPSQFYLADPGSSPSMGQPKTFSFNVTAAVPFNIVVHEVNPGLAIGQAYTLEVGGIAINATTRGGMFDFDGDRMADPSIFRPSVGQWWQLRSSDGGNAAFAFGTSGDVLVPGDYTGDGRTDIAFFRAGTWYVLRSENSSYYAFPFGIATDIPVPGDFDGDGKTDPAVFRAGTWYILNSSGGTTIQGYGTAGDKPVVGDYDGDNKADIAIFRPSNGQWWINRSNAGSVAYTFGAGSDRTVQADFTGDGRTDVAFFRQSVNEWFVLRSEDNSYYSFPFGASGDIPVAGDYDGDGIAESAIFRPSTSTWYKLQSTNGFEATAFGSTGDIPVPSAYVR